MSNESDLIAEARDVADSDAWAIVPRLADALEARRTEAAKLRGVAIAALSRIPVNDNTRAPIKAALAKGEWPADLLEAVRLAQKAVTVEIDVHEETCVSAPCEDIPELYAARNARALFEQYELLPKAE